MRNRTWMEHEGLVRSVKILSDAGLDIEHTSKILPGLKETYQKRHTILTSGMSQRVRSDLFYRVSILMIKLYALYATLRHCENPFAWRSQPFVLGRYPAGNVLLSFAVLLAGASISKVLLVFRHMGLSVYCIQTYFKHQKKFIYPAILHYWETYRASLITQLKKTKDVV